MTDVQAAEEDVAVNQQQHALTDDGDTPPIGSNDNGLGTEAKAMASAKAIE